MAAHRCGRGVFGLKDWDPTRRAGPQPMAGVGAAPPGRPPTNEAPPVGRNATQEPVYNGSITADIRVKGSRPPMEQQPQPPVPKSNHNTAPSQARSDEKAMMAKYSYKANADGPLGKELGVKQGEMLALVEKHENEHWWVARNAQGETGLVPSSYMLIQEKKVSQLPWLQNKDLDRTKEDQQTIAQEGPYKKYQSAYNRDTKVTDEENHHCGVCERSFNGPIPFAAHMKSKAHREELEAQDLI